METDGWEPLPERRCCCRMRYPNYALAPLVFFLSPSVGHADMPKSVKCSIQAQERARDEGPDFRRVYNRSFELCMINSMPREQQTRYFMEKLEPYVAIAPGLQEQPARQVEPKSTGTWVRISPHVWVLED